MDAVNKLEMNKKEKTAYYVLKGLAWMIGAIPRRVGTGLFTLLGHLAFMIHKKRTKTIDNISRAYPDSMSDKEARQLARKVYIHFSLFIFEFLWSRNIKLADYDRWFDVEGYEHFEKAKEKGKGYLFLTAHMGIWELLTFFFAHENLIWNSVYNPSNFVAIDQLMADYRLRFGARKFPIHEALQNIQAAMERKEPVPLLMDLTLRPERGVVVDFFGRRLIANKGMALLAMQTGAPVIPQFLVRENGRYKIIMKPEIPFQQTGDIRKDIEINTQAYNTAIEEIAREYPEQYNWIYSRWKHRPYSPWPRKTKGAV